MPASVLLAVLAAAGLLALAPALVRRYDATERLVAERAQSTARVLQRRRRRRTVPGRRPVNPPRWSRCVTLRRRIAAEPAARRRRRRRPPAAAPPAGPSAPVRPARSCRAAAPTGRAGGRRRHTPAVYRRRRVLAALVLLNVVELVGVVAGRPRLLDQFRGHRHAAARVPRPPAQPGDRRPAPPPGPGPRGGLAGRPAGRGTPRAGPPGAGPTGGTAPAGRTARGSSAGPRWAWTARRPATGGRRLPVVGGPVAGGPPARSRYRRAGGLRGRPYEAGRGSDGRVRRPNGIPCRFSPRRRIGRPGPRPAASCRGRGRFARGGRHLLALSPARLG